jgi:hypothetical protein
MDVRRDGESVLGLEPYAQTANEVKLRFGLGDVSIEVRLSEEFHEAQGEEHAGAGVAEGGGLRIFWGVAESQAKVKIGGDRGYSAAGGFAGGEDEELA